jgi:hypothetical protein
MRRAPHPFSGELPSVKKKKKEKKKGKREGEIKIHETSLLKFLFPWKKISTVKGSKPLCFSARRSA